LAEWDPRLRQNAVPLPAVLKARPIHAVVNLASPAAGKKAVGRCEKTP